MRINRTLPDISLQNVLLAGLIFSVGFVVIVVAFFLGTQWRIARSQPELVPGIVLGTSTQVFTPTETTAPTNTMLPETATPTGNPSVVSETPELTSTPSATSTQISESEPTDWAKLISSSPGNWTYLGPNYSLKKVWTLKNMGSSTWTTDFDLVFISGTRMTDKKAIPLPAKVKPGQTIEITVRLLTPKKPGNYEGYWMLRNNSGELFGIGPVADQALPVKITVLNVDSESRYDFILNRCNAAWWNGQGESVNCAGEAVLSPGYVLLDPMPVLENGSSDKPILWVHTDNRIEGILSGKYPAITIEEGNHFKAKVGCVGGYTKCNVTFKLLYQIGNNPYKSLGSWQELYGGGITTIDVDLSHLKGEEVKFILRVVCSNNTPSAAQGFWMTPRIVYVKPAPTGTPLPTFTSTATPSETPTPSATPAPTEAPTGAPPIE